MKHFINEKPMLEELILFMGPKKKYERMNRHFSHFALKSCCQSIIKLSYIKFIDCLWRSRNGWGKTDLQRKNGSKNTSSLWASVGYRKHFSGP